MKLNMGQLLSIPFILLGIAGLIWSLKKKKKAVIIRE
jgi:prolipoprotein diacylglyceryltransferase